MQVFSAGEVFPGSVLRLELSSFYGVAQLLEPDGEVITSLPDTSPLVMMSQRWLIRFLPLPEAEKTHPLSPSERFTQASQAGHTTHRTIRWWGEKWDFYEHYEPPDTIPIDPNEKPNDDFGGMF